MKYLLTGLAFVCLFAQADTESKIKVAAIDWCPQICPNDSDRPGYVVEILQQVVANSDIELQIDYFPWSRAIKNVREGNYHILLSPAKKEAPDLTYPDLPIGLQKMCFYTLAGSEWLYTNENSLKDLFIGVAEDTSLEELNPYIEKNKEQFQFQPYHERYVSQNIRKLEKKRIDTFLFTRNTTNYIVKGDETLPEIRNAGCVSEALIYAAMTPNENQRKWVSSLKSEFDKLMLQAIENGSVDKVLTKYEAGFSSNDLLLR